MNPISVTVAPDATRVRLLAMTQEPLRARATAACPWSKMGNPRETPGPTAKLPLVSRSTSTSPCTVPVQRVDSTRDRVRASVSNLAPPCRNVETLRDGERLEVL
jgi:hypothetical protein